MNSKAESVQEDTDQNQGIKRKSSQDSANNEDNSDEKSSPNKRPKENEDPLVSIKTEPDAGDQVQIKPEPVDKDEEASTSGPPEIKIKTEPSESTTSVASTSGSPETKIKTEPSESTTNSVKAEPSANADPLTGAVSTNGQSADDSSVSSSSTRPSCRFGIRCYRFVLQAPQLYKSFCLPQPILDAIQSTEVRKLIQEILTIAAPTSRNRLWAPHCVPSATLVTAAIPFTFSSTRTLQTVSRTRFASASIGLKVRNFSQFRPEHKQPSPTKASQKTATRF